MPPYRSANSAPIGLHYSGSRGVTPLLLALGSANAVDQLAFSVDGGETFTNCVAPNGGIWRGAAYSSELGYAIAISQTGIVAQSIDGITWAAVADNLDNSGWRELIWAANLGLFVTTAQAGVAGLRASTSPDGVVWTNRVTPNVGVGSNWSRIVQNPRTLRIFASSEQSSTQPVVFTDDGITWTLAAALPGGISDSCGRGANFYSGLGGNGRVYFSGGQVGANVPDYYTDDEGVSFVQVDATGLLGQATGPPALNQETGFLVRSSAGSGLWSTSANSPGPPGNPWLNRAPNGSQWVGAAHIPELERYVGVRTTGFLTSILSDDGITWAQVAQPGIFASNVVGLAVLRFGS